MSKELSERIARRLLVSFPFLSNQYANDGSALEGIASIVAPHLPSQPAPQAQSDIDKFWAMLDRCFAIEPREYFEKEARTNGFDSPLAMACFYMWKRQPKEAVNLRVTAEEQAADETRLSQPAGTRDVWKAVTEVVLKEIERQAAFGMFPSIADFRVALEAARDTQPAAWQPISSAPSDVSILIYIPNAEHYGEGIYRAIHSSEFNSWTTFGLHVGRAIGGDWQPTHWMPLPASPPVAVEPEDTQR